MLDFPDMDWDDPFQDEPVMDQNDNIISADDCDLHSSNGSDEDEVEESQDGHSSVNASLQKAQELFDFVEVPTTTCHCSCKLGENGTKCIHGFTDEEQESIK